MYIALWSPSLMPVLSFLQLILVSRVKEVMPFKESLFAWFFVNNTPFYHFETNDNTEQLVRSSPDTILALGHQCTCTHVHTSNVHEVWRNTSFGSPPSCVHWSPSSHDTPPLDTTITWCHYSGASNYISKKKLINKSISSTWQAVLEQTFGTGWHKCMDCIL
jgi:hypothetical protein